MAFWLLFSNPILSNGIAPFLTYNIALPKFCYYLYGKLSDNILYNIIPKAHISLEAVLIYSISLADSGDKYKVYDRSISRMLWRL